MHIWIDRVSFLSLIILGAFVLIESAYLDRPISSPSLIILGAFLLTGGAYLDRPISFPSLIILGAFLDRPISSPSLIILCAFLLAGGANLDGQYLTPVVDHPLLDSARRRYVSGLIVSSLPLITCAFLLTPCA